ncbi:hypothetical protein L383_00315 [Enterobacter sp. MGH 37]|jgi:hypothetical protein|nr:hypothetical protein L371_03881 [Enterobacter sp. MGH 25]EUM49970.1 hypothetical protein L383_00315 [Enterobacter sp. MGH 37]CAE7593945.1 hypothetical protein AI2762V1_1317 [Enterobacter cloacae]CZW67266.1 Uncharacterised protein [Enterobacter kobei]CAH3588552.1 hypothetical protein AI2762V1_1317 [Enterobacter cloacae]
MCRINGLPLLIKINKQTTKEQYHSVFAMAQAFMSSGS